MKENVSREEEFEEAEKTYDVSISVKEGWGEPEIYYIKRKNISIEELKLLVDNLENISKNLVIEGEDMGGYGNA